MMFDIPADLDVASQGRRRSQGGRAPEGAVQGNNDAGATGYFGPCPPEGDKPHRYHFKLYALDVAKLDLDANAARRGRRLQRALHIRSPRRRLLGFGAAEQRRARPRAGPANAIGSRRSAAGFVEQRLRALRRDGIDRHRRLAGMGRLVRPGGRSRDRFDEADDGAPAAPRAGRNCAAESPRASARRRRFFPRETRRPRDRGSEDRRSRAHRPAPPSASRARRSRHRRAAASIGERRFERRRPAARPGGERRGAFATKSEAGARLRVDRFASEPLAARRRGSGEAPSTQIVARREVSSSSAVSQWTSLAGVASISFITGSRTPISAR